ncbi:MAG: hypothetical protein NXI32_04760 [bacterium]|nr:hypothetical protein [bacterium]
MSRNVQEAQEITGSNRFKLIAISRLLGLLDAESAKKMVAGLAELDRIGRETRSEVLKDLLKSGHLGEAQLIALQEFCGALHQEIGRLQDENQSSSGLAAEGRLQPRTSAKPATLASMNSPVPEPHLKSKFARSAKSLAVAGSAAGGELSVEGPQTGDALAWPPGEFADDETGNAATAGSDLSEAKIGEPASISDLTAQSDTAVPNNAQSSSKTRSKRSGSRRRRRRDRFSDWEESWDSKVIRFLRDSPEAAFQTLTLWFARGVVWARDHLVITFTVVGLFIVAIWLAAMWPGLFGTDTPQVASNNASTEPQSQNTPPATAKVTDESQDTSAPLLEPRFRRDSLDEPSSPVGNSLTDETSPAKSRPPVQDEPQETLPAATDTGMSGSDAFSSSASPRLDNGSPLKPIEPLEQETPADIGELPLAFSGQPVEAAREINPSSARESDSEASLTEEGSPANSLAKPSVPEPAAPEDEVLAEDAAEVDFPPSVTESLERFILRESYDQAITEIQRLSKSGELTEQQVEDLQLVWTALLLAKADSASQRLAANRLIEDCRFDSPAWRLCYATFLMKSTTDERIGVLSAILSTEFESQDLRNRLIAWVQSRNEDFTEALSVLGDVPPAQCEAGDLMFRGLAYMLQSNREAARSDMQSLLLLLNADIYQLGFTDRLVHRLCEKRLRKTALSWVAKLAE